MGSKQLKFSLELVDLSTFSGVMAVFTEPDNMLYMFNSEGADQWNEVNDMYDMDMVQVNHSLNDNVQIFTAQMHEGFYNELRLINFWVWDDNMMSDHTQDDIFIYPTDPQSELAGIEDCGCPCYVHDFFRLEEKGTKVIAAYMPDGNLQCYYIHDRDEEIASMECDMYGDCRKPNW